MDLGNIHLCDLLDLNRSLVTRILYPSILSKINHIVYSIIANYLFLDGNKRTGACILFILLDSYNYLDKLQREDKELKDRLLNEYVLAIACSQLNEEQVVDTLTNILNKDYDIDSGIRIMRI